MICVTLGAAVHRRERRWPGGEAEEGAKRRPRHRREKTQRLVEIVLEVIASSSRETCAAGLVILKNILTAALFLAMTVPLAAAASLDQCPDFGDPSTTPHCIAQQQFCVRYSSLPFDLASMQNVRRFTDPRDLVALIEGDVSSVSTSWATLKSMGPDVANALASNIIAWYTRNRSSINDAARMHRLPIALDPAEIRLHCIKEGTLDFLDSVP